MAMGPERSRTLHNFSLPCLKWGGQKHLRCVRVQEGDESGGGGGRDQFRPLARRSPPTSSKTYGDFGGLPRKPPEPERKRRSVFEAEDFRRSSSWFPSPPTLAAETEIGRRPAIGSNADDGIEAVRKKLMLDLQTEMDKMKFAVLSERGEKIEPPPTKTVAPVAAEERPWNLRTRRAVCKEPNANVGGGGKSQRVDEGNSSFSPTKCALKSPVRRSDVGSVDYGGIKRPREKFSVPLSKHEIEEDFIAITGVRPPRKPKKRSRNVQKQLDTLFPGLWLSEITADMYKVNENPEARKILHTWGLRLQC
ncbi:hypothetical protein V2J09_003623 [Rumex salicifolius]